MNSLVSHLNGRSIILVGLMGAGKTSIGRKLARRLKMRFIDADKEIVRAAGCSIPEIFKLYGEDAFREGERRVIERLVGEDQIVLATGGGAFMDPETRESIRRQGVSVWLRASVDVLVRRTGRRGGRPMLAGGDTRTILEDLMEKRYPVYAEADIIVDTIDEPAGRTVDKVLEALRGHEAHATIPAAAPLTSDAIKQAERLHVDLEGRSYDIVIGDSLIASAGELIRPVLPQQRVIIISDEQVAPRYLKPLQAAIEDAGIKQEAIVLPAGEATKDMAHLSSLTDRILDMQIDRQTALVALGGGVIGDITGFAAAVLLRGLPFVQVPTTLLAQVDSSVGGKTAINTRHGKNLLGAFYQPRLVIADMDTLDSLPEREFLAGYAETVKYGFLGDAAFFDWLEEHGDAVCGGDKAARRYAVRRSCEMKAKIVAADEREADRRALLNLGHTFGHALEAETGFGGRLLHGEAVAIGMAMAFDLSVAIGLCPAEDAARLNRHLTARGLPTRPGNLADSDWTADRLMAHMYHDKKTVGGRLTLILVRGLGEAFIAREVDEQAILDTWRRALSA